MGKEKEYMRTLDLLLNFSVHLKMFQKTKEFFFFTWAKNTYKKFAKKISVPNI